MGAKFWFGFIGATLALGLAGLILFLLIDAAWYRWGFLGGFLLIAAVLLVIAWILDRRTQKRYAEDYETSG
jgi:Flp pilus assembly protein TadB